MKEEVRNGIVLIISVILIIVIVYFSTALFMTGEIGNSNNKKKTKTTTSYNNTQETYSDMIILSRILSQKDDNYMVVFFSKKDSSKELKDAILNYNGDTKLYKVNLDEPMNKSVKSNTDNLVVSNYLDIKVKDSALITVNSGTITSGISGGAKIIMELK